jgi:hypothetical protein
MWDLMGATVINRRVIVLAPQPLIGRVPQLSVILLRAPLSQLNPVAAEGWSLAETLK